MRAPRPTLSGRSVALAGFIAACDQTPTEAPSALRIDLGPGFVDVSGAIVAAPPFALAAAHTIPDLLEPENSVAVAGDLDGDGRDEVVVSFTNDMAGDTRRSAIFRAGADGQMAAAGFVGEPGAGFPVAAIVDLDGDGRADILTGRRGLGVAWGLGEGRFVTPRFSGTFSRVPLPSIGLADVDEDGWLDLLEGAGYCQLPDVRVLFRTGTREFTGAPPLVRGAVATAPYAVAAVRLGSENARFLLSFGQECSQGDPPIFYREEAVGPDGYPRYAATDLVPGDAQFRRGTPGVPLSRFTPMGAFVDDLNDDGLDDLAVTIQGVFVLQATPGSGWVDRTPASLTGFGPGLYSNRLEIPWGAAPVDVDRDGLKDIVFANGRDSGAWQFGPHTPMHLRIALGTGDFGFADITDSAHVGLDGQWRALAVADLDADGDADLLVGGQGEMPRVWRNDITNRGRGLTLRLRGTTSNGPGVGARVRVRAAAGSPERLYRVGGIFSPYVVAEPLVFVGLGAAERASRVTVEWPSGTVQELRDVPAGGVVTVVEPPSLTVTPAGRHVRADGASAAEILVEPRGLDGSPRPAAAVTAAVVSGAGSVAVEGAGAQWRVRVTAPAAAGWAVVEVRVDGVPVGVRPRIWWDAP